MAKAVPDGTGQEMAKFFLNEVITEFGAPEEIIIDRGIEFLNSVEEMNKLQNIKHRKSTAYHPRTNGLTERMNKSLIHMKLNTYNQ